MLVNYISYWLIDLYEPIGMSVLRKSKNEAPLK